MSWWTDNRQNIIVTLLKWLLAAVTGGALGKSDGKGE